MKKLSELTACVCDFGTGVSFAERLARPDGFGRVLYFKHWTESYATPHAAKIGTGFSNVERVEKFFDIADSPDVDLFIFLCVGMGDLVEYLRRRGKPTWGAGHGEELEQCRWDARALHGRLGLPMQDAVLIYGLDNLRVYLKKNEDVYIKVSKYRGINETWHHWNYELSKARLDTMQADLGPLADEQEFMVEQKIPTKIEVGIDDYNIDGEWPATAMTGIEKKDCGYLITSMPYVDLPKPVKFVSDRLKPAMKQYKYRGNYHSEIRVGENDGKNYLIDNTARIGLPPMGLMQEMVMNWPEIMYHGANGELVDKKMDESKKYGFEFILYSEFAGDHWQGVQYPAESANNIKLYNSLFRRKTGFIVPDEDKMQCIGEVCGFGSTIKEAIQQAEKHADMIKGDRVEVKTDLVPTMLDLLRENKKNGITFGESPIPDTI